MKHPYFFTGAAIFFWGYEHSMLYLAIPLFLIIEGRIFIEKRWNLDENDFVKISDISSIILVASLFLIITNAPVRDSLYLVIKWMPIILLPLMITQAYCSSEKIIIGTRIGSDKKSAHVHKPINFHFLFSFICILSAASANTRGVYFYPVLNLFAFWFFFVNRSKSFSTASFIILFFIVSFTGYLGLGATENLNVEINRKMRNFWSEYFLTRNRDPMRSSTAIGEVGYIKLSDKIILRVKSEQKPPYYLKQSSFEFFRSPMWYTSRKQFTTIFNTEDISLDGENLIEGQVLPHTKQIQIEYYLYRHRGLLPLPYGSYQLHDIIDFKLSMNDAGSVKAEGGRDLIIYQVDFTPSYQMKSYIPDSRNLLISPVEHTVIKKVAESFNASQMSDNEKILKTRRFFNNFKYSIRSYGREGYHSSMENFLLNRKAGHCEYFATTTALLLRELGIPTRYVTGYLVSEKSSLENKYIVRNRDSHAWVEYYSNNKWHILDTTPSEWLSAYENEKSLFEPITSFFYFLAHQYNLARSGKDTGMNIFISIIVTILSLFLTVRIYRQIKAGSSRSQSLTFRKLFFFKSKHSPFRDIEKCLNRTGIYREHYESYCHWIKRIHSVTPLDIETLSFICRLYEKSRFHPEGLSEKEWTDFEKNKKRWILSYKNKV